MACKIQYGKTLWHTRFSMNIAIRIIITIKINFNNVIPVSKYVVWDGHQ